MVDTTAGEGTRAGPSMTRTLLAGGWLVAFAAFAAAAVRLAAVPPALSSDDALFLLNGLTRFSVLDLSPQFPGYPGFVAMGRLPLPLTREPLHALALLSGLMTLALPPLAAALVWRSSDSAWAALAAFAVTLAGPLMPDLALSLLSDGAGIAFLLVFLALLPRPAVAAHSGLVLLAGTALGWAAACRPSDAALFAGAFAGAVLAMPRIAGRLLTGIAIVLVPVALVVLALEGPLYFTEGMRFVSGHALIWGNTPLAPGGQHHSWLDTLLAVPFGPVVAVLLIAGVVVEVPRLAGRTPALTAAVGAFLTHAAWIAAFQNPDHLRHLAPLAVLGGIIFVLAATDAGRRRWGTAAVGLLLVSEIAALASSGAFTAKDRLPPLAAAQTWLATQPAGTAVATNDGVFLLRAGLPQMRVYDMRYPADANLGLATAAGPAFRLSGVPIAGRTAVAEFSARFPGERTLRLYATTPAP